MTEKIKLEEDVLQTSDAPEPLTPPLSDDGENGDPHESPDEEIKSESHEDGEVKEEPDASDNDEDTTKIETVDVKKEDVFTPEPEKPTRKRGRPKCTDKPTAAKTKKQKADTKDKKPKKEADTDASTAPQQSKRGRAPGSTAVDFTPEQDAYLRELFTGGLSGGKKLGNKQIHLMFEERFNSGRSENAIRFRMYKLKEEAIVLSAAEEIALRNAIESIETNKAQAALRIYTEAGGEYFTKLSQAFVWKKIAEWGTGGAGESSNNKKQSAAAGASTGSGDVKQEGGEE
ncbi:hypothetical protein ABW21_db0207712 [Orbilia brochopaga]|nr:hypothetical protein ABW21_db0207712 [Drechslerella brochopaga]